MDSAQIEENVTLEQALRRANLLAAAAEVSHNITQILDIDKLLQKSVDIICKAYDFYYAGVFLINESGEFAVLRAGHGEPGRIMIENNHKLAVGGNSMIGACTGRKEARISLDVDTEKVWYPNPVLPNTRSEMALPLIVGSRVIGAVTVQSVEAAAFSDEDIASLQAMANQLAIAIDNAHNRRELEEAHAELVRTKTFEAIATATGDAIHWIGNKAEPIGGSVERVRHDIQVLMCAAAKLLSPEPSDQPLAQLIKQEAAEIKAHRPEIEAAVARLEGLPLDKVEQQLSVASILEDLDIIGEAATLIIKVKEDLIGPAREQAPRPTMLDDVVQDALSLLDISSDIIDVNIKGSLPLVLADPTQLNRVFVNLINNAWEAIPEDRPDPQISITLYQAENDDFVVAEVADNGVGIPEEDQDKIWATFHSTKTVKGHTGLGLSACRLILDQMGGDIAVSSEVGQGSTFTVRLPVDTSPPREAKSEPGRGKVLIIDDDDHWRQFAVITLESNGYRVATSGENYEVKQYNHYDLIVVDDILRAGDSLDVLKQIDGSGVIFKTVVVSSAPRVERTKTRKLMGIHDLLPKPYTRTSLLSTVKKIRSVIK
jgi:signal transduction histidine kinase/CheY-like chemotaxis protein